jgi:nucleotide-binding universal stress UspA family protein
MFKNILVPVDLSDTELAKASIETAVALARASSGRVRLLNVLPLTPIALSQYVPADFEEQQRRSSEEAMNIVAGESGLDSSHISVMVRQGGIYHEILEEAKTMGADLIVMSSHSPGVRTYVLGSNAGHVVRYARCSVMVVRSENHAHGARSPGNASR